MLQMLPVRTFIKNESQSKCRAVNMVEFEADELLNFLLSQPPAEELQEVNSFSLGTHQQTELRLEEELYW